MIIIIIYRLISEDKVTYYNGTEQWPAYLLRDFLSNLQ